MMNRNTIKKQKGGIVVLVVLFIMLIGMIGIMINYDYQCEHYKPDVVYEMCDRHIIGP